MSIAYVYEDGDRYQVQYTFTPSEGDGWNEPRLEAELDIEAVDGVVGYLCENELLDSIYNKLWNRIHQHEI